MSISVENLSFSYGRQVVLENVSLNAADGEFLSILGSNGAGKTTLLRCMLGLLPKYTGKVLVNGQDIHQLSAAQLARQIAYIPQSHYPAFSYSVFNMVLMGTASQVSSVSGPGLPQKQRAAEALERMGISHLSEKSFSRISGGERQLALIARALAQNARVLILDEPTANLDYGNRLRLMEQAKSLTKDGYTVIQSSHNPEQAYMFSDRIIALKDGQVTADGAPRDTITAELMSQLYGVDFAAQSLYDDKFRVFFPKTML